MKGPRQKMALACPDLRYRHFLPRPAPLSRAFRNPILNPKIPLIAAQQHLASTSEHLADSHHRHPYRIPLLIGALLLGSAVTAFGLAPTTPDPALLPKVLVTESLTAVPLHLDQSTVQAPLTLYRSENLRNSDTAQSLLARLGVEDPSALAFLQNDEQAKRLLHGRSGKLVTIEATTHNRLVRLSASWLSSDENRFERLVVEMGPEGLQSRVELGALTATTQLASGTIRSSLFAATDAAGVPDSVATQLAEMFGSDIDFRRDLRQGDHFSVVYESLEADGEFMRPGRVLSAEFFNDGREHERVWFEAPGQKGAYFGFDGSSLKKSFLSSPLQFSRVSSGYGMRFHPISGVQKPHLGVDFAAPTGTPVRTIGDGTVTFAGVQRGFGNVIYVQHRNNQETVYGHLSRIDVRKGQNVNQGDFIGAVGSTGASTGPHLHLEFRDKGVHQDPLLVARESQAVPVSPALRAQFDAVAQLQRVNLDAATSVQQARAD